MIAGFEHRYVSTSRGARISTHTSGEGPPLLFLHGYPQNHHTWGKVAPEFAARFSCVVPDLPGYGDSSVAESDSATATGSDEPHRAYSKRTMAQDMLELMQALGHESFSVLGHDRGARVAYRLALDSDAVEKLGIIDVIPTGEMWAEFGATMALGAYHWPFLAQPYPLPETLIKADPEFYLEHTLKSWSSTGDLECFEPDALASYRAQMRDPVRVHAMCEDYRAGATIDWTLDDFAQKEGHQIQCPLHFVWTSTGFPSNSGDPLDVWKKWANTVTGDEIAGGHFAQEENPSQVIHHFMNFFT